MRHRKPLAEAEKQALRRCLLRWYDRQRRDLPWRRTSDPYRIWIAEVMLQQTRVQAVIPYYHRFLRRFPNVSRLAQADPRQLLACWSGLGYYSRARNLQKAARCIVQQHGGRFPREADAAMQLPGVGEYTAAAVLSIAYGQPLPVLDGNVARVLSRLHATAADAKQAAGKRRLLRMAGELLSLRRPGDFNQAMMELGATICLPSQPQCGRCPVRMQCIARAQEAVDRFPPPRQKAKPVLKRYAAALVQDAAGRILLVQRPAGTSWMGGFWELPMWETSGEVRPQGLAVQQRMGLLRHSITGYRLEVEVFRAAKARPAPGARRRWLAASELHRFPVTTITRKALALARRHKRGNADSRLDPAS